jgi:hypothetical protein
MFHWICPECGREMAPNALECPACDPKSAEKAAETSVDVPAPVAQPVRIDTSVPVPTTPEVLPQPPAEPALEVTPAGLLDLAVALQPEPASEPALRPAADEIPTMQVRAPLEPSRDVVPETSGAPEALLLATAVLEPVPALPIVEQALATVEVSEAATVEIRPAQEPAAAAELAAAPPVAPPVAPPEPDPPVAKLWPLGSIKAIEIPVKPMVNDANPLFTLPGPALPPVLASITEVTIISGFPAPPRRVAGWLISVAVAIGLLLGGTLIARWFWPSTPPPSDRAGAAQSVQRVSSNPLSKYIELSGVRVVMETNRSEIRYNVVNHSAAELGDLTLHVLLRATTAQESQPPVSRFSFKLPSLGPYESREMVSVVEKINRVYEIPDWRNLKAEFQITSP